MIDRDVSDALTQHVWDELAAEFGSFVAGTGGRFERVCNEDAGFGEDDDDAPLLVKRNCPATPAGCSGVRAAARSG